MAATAPAAAVSPPPGSTQEATPTPTRPDSDVQAVKIIPKGLRSFDQHDAHFFLELLPGPRDRDGLPESLRFWKTRIESTDPDATFKVGLIYGPSGCGKSSMVKAGLLPRLDKNVLAVYIEATSEETEARLLRGLRKACPDLPTGRSLVETLAALRRGRVLRPGQKVLLVLDQLEQWLFARRGEEHTELVAALRHCDGEHVQALVLVRDDFWLAASRFLRDLEIDLEPSSNIALVDLFDLQHARKVLVAFGKAYGKMPERDRDQTREQVAFLDQAVAGLAQDGKVISVRLALFAEMIKGKPWTPATLRAVGGTAGVGVTFLEETFASAQANPKHRLHQKAAQAVLKALRPQTGTDIKGQMRSEGELREVAGYAARPRDFAELIYILDSELRLITPTDPEGSTVEGPSVRESRRSYQLTHDYLVHSLRDWLTRKQRETRRGRAELRLAERATIWNTKPENRHLPSVWEWVNIRLLTRKRDWTEPQRTMMRALTRYRILRGMTAVVVLFLAGWGVVEASGRFMAGMFIDTLPSTQTKDMPGMVFALTAWRRWIDPRLRTILQQSREDSKEHLHASLALVPVDPTQVDYLAKCLSAAQTAPVLAPSEVLVIRDTLMPHRSILTPKLWSVLDSAEPGDAGLLPSAVALALYDPASARWDDLSGKVAEALVTVNSLVLAPWLEALRPVRSKLTTPLAAIFRDQQCSEDIHLKATDILADFAQDDPGLLAELLMVSEPKSFLRLVPVAQRQAERILSMFQAELAKRGTTENTADSEQLEDERAERQARAAVALIRLGHADEVWPLLRHSADPRLRSFLVNWLEPLGADPKAVVAELGRLDSSPPPAERREGGRRPGEGSAVMDAILFHPETSMRRALILALGTYDTRGLSPGEREPLIGNLLDLYRHDPDAGIHGAAAWTLRQWGQEGKVQALDVELAQLGDKDRGARRWYVNGQLQTFVLVEGPIEFRMGSPPDEPDRDPDETSHRRVIPRRFAIAAKEVTVEQYQRFAQENSQFGLAKNYRDKYSPEPDGPMIAVAWFGAAAYCNWLSRQEGLPKDQWCYLPNAQGRYDKGMTLPADALRRTGYRLPIEAEWEYACRAGAMTSRPYGLSINILKAYARYQANSKDHAWKCGGLLPNDLGLFDMLGNVIEWCQERHTDYQPGKAESTIDEIIDDVPRLRRGGTFDDQPAIVRSAFRNWVAPSIRGISLGFRPARTVP